MDSELYNKKIKEIDEKYDSKDTKASVGLPVAILLQEAENLYHWCKEDKDQLINAGLDWNLAEDIPARVDLLQEVEAKWFSIKRTKNKKKKDFQNGMTQVRELHAGLLRDFRFAFHNDKDLLKKLSRLSGYKPHDEILMELRVLAGIGKQNISLLEAINFDTSQLETAEKLSKDTSYKMSAHDVDIQKGVFKDQHKKACLYLKDAVALVRRCGQYVFHGNKERLVGYRSEYRYLHKGKRKKKQPEQNQKLEENISSLQ